jgi:hypothetical protein
MKSGLSPMVTWPDKSGICSSISSMSCNVRAIRPLIVTEQLYVREGLRDGTWDKIPNQEIGTKGSALISTAGQNARQMNCCLAENELPFRAYNSLFWHT